MFELKGALKVVNESVQVTEKFKKREFVLTDDSSQYPQDIAMQLTQDNCDKLNGVSVGDRLLVKFNLRGRAWNDPKTGNDRYFNSLDAWFIQKEDSNNSVPTPPAQPVEEFKDDLPF